MRILIVRLVLVALLLTGCFGGGARIEPAYFGIDMDEDSAVGKPGAGILHGLMLRQIEVQAPSWLDTPAMQYRLLYAEGARRLTYAESRWIASPAEQLEQVLTHRILSGQSEQTQVLAQMPPALGCRLHVDLVEFIQSFDRPGSSQALIEVRANLMAPRGEILLARRAFGRTAEGGTDAKSGVAGFGIALRELTRDLNGWLARMTSETPAVVIRCRSG